jgi:hypothetical protein
VPSQPKSAHKRMVATPLQFVLQSLSLISQSCGSLILPAPDFPIDRVTELKYSLCELERSEIV